MSTRYLRYLIPVVAVIVAYSGFRFGMWLFSRGSGLSPEDERWIDEYHGLAERTDQSRRLGLSVEPSKIVVRVGQPIIVKVRLVNKSKKSLVLNSWLRPYPDYLKSNQFPLKISVERNGEPLFCRGNPEVRPPHTRKDFFILEPGASKEINFDLTSRHGSIVWDFSEPGRYVVSVWYESYLTGRAIGVKAFTGKTNVARTAITVLP